MSKEENKPAPLTWEKRCEESNGTMVMLPEEFREAVTKLEEELKELDELNVKVHKMSENQTLRWNTMWARIREKLAEKFGDAKIYTPGTTIGWDKQAKQEGKYVINIVPPQE
jgi:hypothetical protein